MNTIEQFEGSTIMPTAATNPTSSVPSFHGGAALAHVPTRDSQLQHGVGGKTISAPPISSPTPPSQAIYHADSGVRFNAAAESSSSRAPMHTDIPDDVPPEYTEH